ncbi:Uncharacterised protein [uncultured archaeon]|nr:Uncharacterised protein [uncultured archaeon]
MELDFQQKIRAEREILMSETTAQEVKKDLIEKKNQAKQIRIHNYGTISDLKELYSKFNDEKTKRDEFTAQVKKIKEQREEILLKLKDLEAKFNELLGLLKKEEKSSEVPYFKLRQDLERLEWQLQTEATTPKLEKELSLKIRDIEKQLKKADKIKPIQDQLNAVKKEVNQFRKIELESRNNLNLLARKSQHHHKQAIEFQEQITRLRENLGEGMNKLDEMNKEISAVSTEFQEIINVEKQKSNQEFQEYQLFQQERKQKMKEKLDEIKSEAQEIYDKFKKGEKLKFEDIQKLQAAGLL